MKIKSIELYNIRSHKRSKIEFNDGITILSGRTGSGKSSFLLSIEYALFGADSSLTNNMILRRGASEGHVKLVFTQSGKEYEVMRGLIRKGKGIATNPDKLWIKEDGKKLPIISRSNEINEQLLKILHYPLDVKPKELFEVTSYAKQDEIRKLIEMTNENRQKYVDRVLQLSKYQLTWENLKELINELKNKLSNLEGLTEALPRTIEECGEKKEELKNNENALVQVENKLGALKKELEDFKEKYDKIKVEYEKALLDDKKIKEVDAKILELKRQKEEFEKEISRIKTKLEDYKSLKETNINEIIEKHAKISQEVSMLKDAIKELQKELLSIDDLKGRCPLCKQEINEEHKQKIKDRYYKEMQEKSNKLSKLKSELETVSLVLREAEQIKEALDKKKNLENELSSKENLILQLEARISNLLEQKKTFKTVANLDELKREYEKLIDKDKELSSEYKALSERQSFLKQLVSDLKNEVKSKEELIKELNEKEKEIKKLNKDLTFITRVREDIRNIREVVRARFLENLRREFSNKYEELREDDEYVMDVLPNYEPIAYDSGTKVPIQTLSGGEKTSVALAYRLALAEIAANVSDIDKPELLILDEPTYGFDRIDIKALPQTLRNIKTIPQIIIVSHEEELKQSADYKYEVDKKEGTSIVMCL